MADSTLTRPGTEDPQAELDACVAILDDLEAASSPCQRGRIQQLRAHVLAMADAYDERQGRLAGAVIAATGALRAVGDELVAGVERAVA